MSGFIEARGFTPFGVATQSQIVKLGSSGEAERIRLNIAITHYNPESVVTYRAGDVIAGGFEGTRPIRIDGFQVRRSFNLRPDLVTLPLPSTSGSAAVPSTADVYLNGFKTLSQAVEPGPYQIMNLAIYGRGGTARIVVRDALGREVETKPPFFVSSTLLAPGLVDFSLEAGAPRLYYATERDSYVAKPVASGSIRTGLTDSPVCVAGLLGEALTFEEVGGDLADLFLLHVDLRVEAAHHLLGEPAREVVQRSL